MKKEMNYQTDNDPSIKTFILVLIGGIFAVVGGLALIGHLMSKKNEEGETEASASGASNIMAVSTGGFKCMSNRYPLQLGTCHPDVKILQQHFKKLGATLGDTGKNKDGVDGRFGTKTQAAARKYLNKEVFNIQDVQNITKA